MHTHTRSAVPRLTPHKLIQTHRLCTQSAPKTRAELKAAVDTCLRASSVGECSKALGPIAEWDVSRVTDMNEMFYNRKSSYSNYPDISKFNADISKWNVSRVTNMQSMFYNAQSFNVDISKWDVSRVTNMQSMFSYAKSFNADISKWNVSSVTNMDSIFNGATSFSRKLCGTGWIVSQVPKNYAMFTGSSAQICFGSQPHAMTPTA